jgi:DNA-binding NtrC family response regulator
MVTDPVLDILIVEDEMNTNILAQRIKEEFRENVKIHTNGHGVMNDLEPFKDLDIIILDQQYAKEDVVRSLKQIRKKSPYTEVIVLSSENESRIIDDIKGAGAYDYIYKDQSAIDKIVYVLKGFWSNKRLQKENIQLKDTKKRSTGTVVAMVILVLALIGLLIYLFV